MSEVLAPAALATATARPRLDLLPIGLFGSVMGLTGPAVAWRLAHARHGAPGQVAGGIAIPAVTVVGLLPMHGVMVLGLAVGLFFAVPRFTLILVAPFAVGFSSYVTTTGQVDLFAQSLYVLTLFTLAVLLGRLRHLPRCCPFRVSWWAVSFPLAASAIAALHLIG